VQEYGLLMDKYYFYNPETGCDWEEKMASKELKKYLERKTWIKEGEEARELKQQAEIKRNCNG